MGVVNLMIIQPNGNPMKTCQLCLILLFLISNISAQNRCAADAYLKKQLKANPELEKVRKDLETFTQNWDGALMGRSLVTIPIVVHIVWKTPEQNISNEQILSQIEVLNQDFRALNSNLDQVPPE